MDLGQVVAGLAGLLQTGEERVHHPAVAVEREDQRHVDADALGQGPRDRGRPSIGGRDLDQHVGPVDGGAQLLGLLDRPVGVMGQPGLDLDRDLAVDVAGGLPGRPEDVAGLPDVLGGDLEDGPVDVDALRRQLAHLSVVRRAVGQRSREDRRVGRDADDVLVVDQALQAAAGDPLAGEVVEPDGDAEVAELGRGSVMSCSCCCWTVRC